MNQGSTFILRFEYHNSTVAHTVRYKHASARWHVNLPGPYVASAVCAVVVHTAQQGFIHRPYVALTQDAVRVSLHTHSYSYTHPDKTRKHRTHGHGVQDGTKQ